MSETKATILNPGAEWLERQRKHWFTEPKAISPLGETVADILDKTWCGIYHLDTRALRRSKWDDPYVIIFILSYRNLATVDSNELTQLVVHCHDYALRLDISAVAPHRLELMFHQRTRDGDFYHRCPSLEKHVDIIRKGLKQP